MDDFKVEKGYFINLKFIYIYFDFYGYFWFRWWTGNGWHVKNLKKQCQLFSERNGYTKIHIIGNYQFKRLKNKP